jgi:copper chaperone CopZ
MNKPINTIKDKNEGAVLDKHRDECGAEKVTLQIEGTGCGCACGTTMPGIAVPTSNVDEAGGAGLEEVMFRIDGVCSCEAYIVEKPVMDLKGVSNFRLNPFTSQMTLRYDPSVVSVLDIQSAVKKAGANAVLMTSR